MNATYRNFMWTTTFRRYLN